MSGGAQQVGQSRLAGYAIEATLGRGHMGEVYRARPLGGGAPVALKLLGSSAAEAGLEARIRFEHEVQLLARLSHPNIVALKEHGACEGRPYLVMELMDGVSLASWLERHGPLAPHTAAEVVRQAALALAHAHGEGILHRDVKPSNLMVKVEGQVVTAKMVDFGLGRLRDDGLARTETVGTFLYMAPEQIGILHRPIDERSDLYSLGMLAYEALAGRPPFDGKDLQALIHAHAAVMPPQPAGTPPGLWQIVQRLIRKDPNDRYRTARGAAADLGEFVKRIAAGNGATFELGARDWAVDLAPPSLAGREAELAELRAAYEGVRREGRLGVAAIAGPSGVGKSRLVQELQRECAAAGGLFLSGRGRAYGQAAAYGLFAEALQQLATQPLGAELVERVRRAAGDLGGDVTRLVPEMAAVLGDPPPLAELEPSRRQQRFFSVLTRLLGALGTRETPVALFLDDLQWADEGSLGFLEHLGRQHKGLPLLLVTAHRTGESSTAAAEQALAALADAGANVRRIALAALDLDAVRRLTASMLGAELPEVADLAFERCAGNPLFAVELLRAFRDGGALVHTESGWEVDAARLSEAGFGGGLIDILLGRIGQLQPRQRELLTVAAVAGKEFDLEVLRRAVAPAEQQDDALRELLAALDAAAGHQLVMPLRRGGHYALTHDKVREALYDALPPERRAALHERVGLAVETCAPDASYLLAYHFARSSDARRAVRYAVEAGDRANEAHGHLEALAFYDQALERWERLPEPRDPGQRLRILEGIGDACSMVGRYERALQSYTAVLEGGATGLRAADVLGKAGAVSFRKGDVGEAVKALLRALAALGERFPRGPGATLAFLVRETFVQAAHTLFGVRRAPSTDPAHRAIGRIYNRLVYSLYYLSESFGALSASLRYLNLMERHQVLEELGQAYTTHGVLCLSVPLFRRGLRYEQLGIATREKQGDRWGVAQGRYFYQMCLRWAGRYRDSKAQGALCKEDFEQLGDRWELCGAIYQLAISDYHLGRWQSANALLHELLAIADDVGDGFSRARAAVARGEMSSAYGSERCLPELDKAIALCLKAENMLFAITLLGVKGQVLLRLGRGAESVAMLEQAMELNRKYGQRTEYTMKCYPTMAEAYLAQAEAEPHARDEWLRKARLALRVALFRTRFYPVCRSYSLRMHGRLLWLTGRRARALRVFRAAHDHALQLGVPYDQALVWMDVGRLLHAAGDPRGRNTLELAVPIFRAVGASEDAERVLELLGEAPGDARPESVSLAGSRSETRSPIEAARFATLLDIGQELSSTLDQGSLLEKILASAVRVLGAERGILFLSDDKGALSTRSIHGGSSTAEFPASTSVAEEVFRSGQTLALADAQTDSRFHAAASVVASGVRWILCAPLRLKARSIGVLYLDNRLVRGQFTEADRAVLQALASQAAIALHNASTFADLERTKKELSGLLPICASCKRIRDDTGYWSQIETYIQAHSEADFSHGVCPECIAKLYPDYAAALEKPRPAEG